MDNEDPIAASIDTKEFDAMMKAHEVANQVLQYQMYLVRELSKNCIRILDNQGIFKAKLLADTDETIDCILDMCPGEGENSSDVLRGLRLAQFAVQRLSEAACKASDRLVNPLLPEPEEGNKI